MQLARNNSNDTRANTLSRCMADTPASGKWLEYVLIFSVALAGLMALSLLLPPDLAQTAQAVIGWGMAASVLTVAVLAAVRSLETLLDC